MSDEKHVDESWKDSVEDEKKKAESTKEHGHEECGEDCDHDHGIPDVNFVNYVSSLSMQALIFLGEIPNPMTNEKDENVPQAKFIIDTLAMLRDKTKGNLDQQEEDLLNSAVSQLQMKFVEHAQGKSTEGS